MDFLRTIFSILALLKDDFWVCSGEHTPSRVNIGLKGAVFMTLLEGLFQTESPARFSVEGRLLGEEAGDLGSLAAL